MRAPRHYLLLSGFVAACGGGGDESTAATHDTTSVTGNMTASPDPGGVSATTGSSDTTPTSDPTTSTPAPGAPVFLSLKTNVSKITAGETVVFTAILTDPDGVDDIVGGELSDESGMIGYGPFVAAGQEGTYSITLSWDAMHQAEPIQFEGMDGMRVFRAEFYDQATHKVSKEVSVALTCAEGSACDGVCTDIMASAEHCGSCTKSCEGGCDTGQCAPKWEGCFEMASRFDTCTAYCASLREVCVENGCENNSTSRGFADPTDCQEEVLGSPFVEPCDQIQPWGPGRKSMQCCCTDSP